MLKLKKDGQKNQIQLSVSDITNSISNLLSSNFSNVYVVGEISNFKEHSSGHRYFILKDDKSQINGVMWRTRILNFIPKDGMKVLVQGSVTVYPSRGQYQLDCQMMQPLGKGDLFLAFEQMKEKLEQKGYFDESNKKTIPLMAQKIGVSTSPTGAAVQDIFSTIGRRFPLAEVYFRPTLVQGEGSAEDIASAIKELDKLGLDILIVGRGGGSIEDLWSYNTEIVADAIYKANTPIISAVGHETDFTIADFTADLRAATPTAAAELSTKIQAIDLQNDIENDIDLLNDIIRNKIDNYKQNITNSVKSYGLRRVSDRLNNYMQKCDELESQLKKVLKNQLIKKKSELDFINAKLLLLHPLSPLEKGFAILKRNDKIIKADEKLSEGTEIVIKRKNQSSSAVITK